MATELDRRVGDEQPATWSDLVTLGVGVARAVLGEEPKRDVRPWVRGCEPELSGYDQAISNASIRKRQAETWEEWSESVAEVRRCNVGGWRGFVLRRWRGGCEGTTGPR